MSKIDGSIGGGGGGSEASCGSGGGVEVVEVCPLNLLAGYSVSKTGVGKVGATGSGGRPPAIVTVIFLVMTPELVGAGFMEALVGPNGFSKAGAAVRPEMVAYPGFFEGGNPAFGFIEGELPVPEFGVCPRMPFEYVG